MCFFPTIQRVLLVFFSCDTHMCTFKSYKLRIVQKKIFFSTKRELWTVSHLEWADFNWSPAHNGFQRNTVTVSHLLPNRICQMVVSKWTIRVFVIPDLCSVYFTSCLMCCFFWMHSNHFSVSCSYSNCQFFRHCVIYIY